MIDGRYIFGQPVKNDIRTYENNNKFPTGERDYSTRLFLFPKKYNLIVRDLNKQQVLDTHLKSNTTN